ncbi:hypothetical protein GCM10023107_72730 [Actinoplanes octamycinicus]|nr:hypothetical protein Aoc01nite_61670 [Actinoplanes octamycinicus]
MRFPISISTARLLDHVGVHSRVERVEDPPSAVISDSPARWIPIAWLGGIRSVNHAAWWNLARGGRVRTTVDAAKWGFG